MLAHLVQLKRSLSLDRFCGCLLTAALTGALAACGQADVIRTRTPAPPEPLRPTSAERPVGSPTATVTRTSQTGAVRIYFDWDPAEVAALESRLADFGRDHPTIDVHLIYVPPAELLSRSTEDLAEGQSGPTMVIGPSRWGEELSRQGLIRDLSESLSGEMISRIHPHAWAQVRQGRRVLGLPLEMQGIVLFRNSAIIGDRPAAVDELVLAAQAVEGDDRVGASLDFSLLNTLPFLETCGADLDQLDDQPPFELVEGLCWLRLLNRLGRTGPPVFDSADDLTAFQSGRSALLIDRSDRLPALQEALGEGNLTVDSWPEYPLSEANLQGFVWAETMYFASQASQEDFEASWALATFLLSPESQAALSQSRRVNHQSVLADLPVDDPMSVRLRSIFESGRPLLEDARLATVREPLQTAVRLVVAASGDIELALELALTEIANSSPVQPTETPSPAATGTGP